MSARNLFKRFRQRLASCTAATPDAARRDWRSVLVRLSLGVLALALAILEIFLDFVLAVIDAVLSMFTD